MSETFEDNVDNNADKMQGNVKTTTEPSSKGLNLDSGASVSGLTRSLVFLPTYATMILRSANIVFQIIFKRYFQIIFNSPSKKNQEKVILYI